MNEQALIAEARRSLSGATGFIYTRALAERLLGALVEAHERLENMELADREHDHEFEDCCLICGISAIDYYQHREVGA